jgi:hypothetical protein
LQICVVTNYRWVQMEVAFFAQDQWCNCMVIVWARCLHSSFQTHSWILNIGKEFHVNMVQHLVKDEHK